MPTNDIDYSCHTVALDIWVQIFLTIYIGNCCNSSCMYKHKSVVPMNVDFVKMVLEFMLGGLLPLLW